MNQITNKNQKKLKAGQKSNTVTPVSRARNERNENATAHRWMKCTTCNFVCATDDSDKHNETCSLMQSVWRESASIEETARSFDVLRRVKERDSGKFLHNFMSNSLFCAMSVKKSLKDILPNETTTTAEMKKHYEDAVVSLPFFVMGHCSIPIGSLVLMTNERGHQIIRVAMPSFEYSNCIGMTATTFRSFGISTGDFVAIELYQKCAIKAGVMVLKPKIMYELYSRPKFSEYLKSYKEGLRVAKGNYLSILYLGNLCELEVISIVGVEGKHEDARPIQQHTGCGGKNENATNAMDYVKECDKAWIGTPKHNAKHNAIRTSTPIRPTFYENPPALDSMADFDQKFFCIANCTKILIENGESKKELSNLSYKNIGGLGAEISKVQEKITGGLRENHKRSTGIIIHGPSGIGKSLLAKTVAAENRNHHFILIRGAADICRTYVGESETALKEIFTEARCRSPTIILCENIDDWCSKTTDQSNSQKSRLVSTLLSEMDNLKQEQHSIFVLATTNKVSDLHPELRRSNRFEHEIELRMPNELQRKEILSTMLTGDCGLNEADISFIAKISHGRTGADLEAIIRDALHHAIRNVEDCLGVFSKPRLSREDLKNAVKRVPPSVTKEFAIDHEEVYWTDIGGQEKIKMKFQQTIQWPLEYPEFYTHVHIRPIRGVLLYGPPGCSKTMMANAIATEAGFNFIKVETTDIFSKYVGDSEAAIRRFFEAARNAAPSILFIDEIDSIAGSRGSSGGEVESRVLSQCLLEMDETIRNHKVIVVGATNRLNNVDQALRRPGRLERIIYVPLPDANTRREIFQIRFRKLSVTSDVSIAELVTKTDGYSGDDIFKLCDKALCEAFDESSDPRVSTEHFSSALRRMKVIDHI